jgi:membrane dipeptidase
MAAAAAVVASTACGSGARPAPGETENGRARRIHEHLLALDTHLDTPANFISLGWSIMRRHDAQDWLSRVDYPRMVEGGLDGGFWAIFTPQGPRTPEGDANARDQALRTAIAIREMVARNERRFEIALRSGDAAAIAARGKRVVYLSIENAYPVEHDLTLLQTFYSLGVRLLGVVHFQNNDLGDSSTDPKGKEWGGLSPLGMRLVAEANRLGMVLDASHASDDVFDQMLAISKTPIILSHSGCRAIVDHPRNIDDDRLRRLAAAGGVIQMNMLGDYLVPTPNDPARKEALQKLGEHYGPPHALDRDARPRYLAERRAIDAAHPQPRATFDDYMKQVLHALEVVGPDHVGIGADWDGGGGVVGLEDVSGLPKITERLLAAGYSESDLAKIWSGNVLRVLRAAEDARAASP